MQLSFSETESVIGVIALSVVTLVSLIILLLLTIHKITVRRQQSNFNAILDAVEKEKQRIGRDLHDDIGPILSTSIKGMDKLIAADQSNPIVSQLMSYRNSMTEALEGVKSSAYDLMPAVLVAHGLQKALEEMCSRITSVEVCKVTFKTVFQLNLSAEENLALYRIVMELVNNAVKYSGASEINVIFDLKGKSIVIAVKDNGRGFKVTEAISSGAGMGIGNVVTRAKLIGASFNLNSVMGKGSVGILKYKPQKSK
ncbi:MAG: ATP-binding protein [Bacteroidota bacterium]